MSSRTPPRRPLRTPEASPGRQPAPSHPPVPNRPLDLGDLERPHFREVNARLDALRRRLPELHLHSSKRWEVPWALERARLAPASRVLDVGCGASVLPLFLAEEGHAGWRWTASYRGASRAWARGGSATSRAT